MKVVVVVVTKYVDIIVCVIADCSSCLPASCIGIHRTDRGKRRRAVEARLTGSEAGIMAFPDAKAIELE